jgi:hypothetical protein
MPQPQANILVVFYSRDGSVEALANVVSLYIPMAHLGFIIVPNGYTHEKILQGHGTPYQSSSVSGQNSAPPTADELEVAKHQSARVTQVAGPKSPTVICATAVRKIKETEKNNGIKANA